MYGQLSIQQEKKRGFTLIEMIVVIALCTIVSGALMSGIAAFYRFNGYAVAQAYQIAHAREGTERMIRDLREMTYADDGTFPLVVMEDNEVGFYSDIDRDDSVEYVEYLLASTTLELNIYAATGSPPVYSTTTPESSVVLSEYIQNSIQAIPMFRYYDENGDPATPTSTVTDIRYVEVSVIVNIDPVRDPGQFMLRSSASLRNLKSYE
jgi:prepilin-type N-terminal cleavage/methylation domain-containing protein